MSNGNEIVSILTEIRRPLLAGGISVLSYFLSVFKICGWGVRGRADGNGCKEHFWDGKGMERDGIISIHIICSIRNIGWMR